MPPEGPMACTEGLPQPRPHPKRSRQSSCSEHTTRGREGQEPLIEHFPGAPELGTTRGRQPHPCPRGAHSLAGERQGKKPGAGRGAAPGQALPTGLGGGPLLPRSHGALSSAPSEALPLPLLSSSPPTAYPTLCTAADPCVPGRSSALSRRTSLEQPLAARRQQGRVRSGRRWSRTASLETPKEGVSPTRPPRPRPAAGAALSACHPACPVGTWLQGSHRQQLDEVPTLEAEETVVVGDVASQGDDVAGVLWAGGQAGEGPACL